MTDYFIGAERKLLRGFLREVETLIRLVIKYQLCDMT